MDPKYAVRTIDAALKEAHATCLVLRTPAPVLKAINDVQKAQPIVLDTGHIQLQDKVLFAAIYKTMTALLSDAVLQEADVDRSFLVYDVMLMLFSKTKPAFNTLYPGETFVSDNGLYF